MRTGGTLRKFDVTPEGRARGHGPEGFKIHFVPTYSCCIYNQIMKSRIQRCKKFAPGACLGVTRGQKVGFYFDCHTTPLRLIDLEP